MRFDPFDSWNHLVRAALIDTRVYHTRTIEPARPLSPVTWQILAAIDLPPVTDDASDTTYRALRVVSPNAINCVEAQSGRLVRARLQHLVDDFTRPDDTVDLTAENASRLPLPLTLDVL